MKLELSDPRFAGKRLDTVLAGLVPELSRSRLQQLIRQGHVLVNGAVTKVRQPVAMHDRVEIEMPAVATEVLAPEQMALSVLFEDEHLIVLDKPSGLVVHPGAGHSGGTLVHGLLSHCAALSVRGGEERPGIVHRLDKDTSGCLVAAKTDRAHEALSRQFAQREVVKHYLAVVRGAPARRSGVISNHMARHPVNRQKMAVVDEERGKLAVTEYECGPAGDGATLICCRLHTGRTHQIRVHLHSLGCPLLGDAIYGRMNKGLDPGRLLLHSWYLRFTHPVSGVAIANRAPVPPEFEPWIDDESISVWQAAG